MSFGKDPDAGTLSCHAACLAHVSFLNANHKDCIAIQLQASKQLASILKTCGQAHKPAQKRRGLREMLLGF